MSYIYILKARGTGIERERERERNAENSWKANDKTRYYDKISVYLISNISKRVVRTQYSTITSYNTITR